jgi:hypothetical protein
MAAHFNPESVDLAQVARFLRDAFGEEVAGAVIGRTALRNEVIRCLECSALEAEQLVDTMVSRGFIVPVTQPDAPAGWAICESPR